MVWLAILDCNPAHLQDFNELSYGMTVKNKRKMGLINRLLITLKKMDALVMDRFIGNSAKDADLVLCQTFAQKLELYRNTGVHSEVIRNSFFPSDKSGTVDKEKIILWVGNLRPVKRPDFFLKLVDELPIDGWRYILIGRSAGYEKEIENIKNPDFQALGELPYSETLHWFKKASIIINSSISEGFPNTFIQAWLHRVTILSLKVDPDNLLKHNELGYVADDNFEKLKAILIKLTKSPTFNSTMHQNAFNFALQALSIKKNVDKLEQLLEKISV